MTNHLKRMRPHYFSISSPSTLNKKVARRHFADVMRQTRLGRLGLLPKDCYHYFSVLKSDSFLFDHEPEVIRGPFNAFFVLFFYFQKLMWMVPFLLPINRLICDPKCIAWKNIFFYSYNMLITWKRYYSKVSHFYLTAEFLFKTEGLLLSIVTSISSVLFYN